MNANKSNCWSLMAIDGQTQYGGNEGYQDRVSEIYSYDSNVANHKNLKSGDVVILRNRGRAIGAAVIDEIRSQEGTKELNRCPACDKTQIKQRKKLKPVWRCAVCQHTFDDPRTEAVPVTKFEASYGSSFISLPDGPDAREIKSADIKPNDQMSIALIDPYRIDWSSVPHGEAVEELILLMLHRNYVVAGMSLHGNSESIEDSGRSDDYIPNSMAKRQRVLREISARQGQPKFRKGLFIKYRGRCVLSGCTVPEALEAAHIAPYRSDDDNAQSNGLLLRSDIHTLFDLDLIGIDPNTSKVVINPHLSGTEYEALEKKSLNAFEGKLSQSALEMRWRQFQCRMKESI
jgi:putative restriction endonuclease